MTSETRVIDVPGVTRFEIAPHHCFACGTLNATGMGLLYGWRPLAEANGTPGSVDGAS